MSETLENFKSAASDANWPTAIMYCNGLNMYEMLRGLNSLPLNSLNNLQAQLGNFAGQYNIDRIYYAIEVVKDRKLPDCAPGDLEETRQVQDARIFLASTPSGSTGQKFYHGTSLTEAKRIMTMDLEPRAVPEASLLDVNEYTDFGKGFYTHPEESKSKALEWAKRRNQDWGVVRFTLTSNEFNGIAPPKPLQFSDKFKTRPNNAPKLFGSQPATWIEFVEFNRHVQKVRITRPKDNDWTMDYGWIRGPIWGRKDSNLPGPPGLPECYHQINWGVSGMAALNSDLAKQRRFLFTKHNEDDL